MIDIHRVSNANVYLDGASQLGRVQEVEVPQVKTILSDHAALGLFGKLKLPTGIDYLEASFKWSSYYGDVLAKVGNPYRTTSVQVRANVEMYDSDGLSAEVPLVIHFKGNFVDPHYGKFKQHDNVELETKMNVWYVKVVLDGRVVVEIDVLANTWKVDGEDILANYRRNIGAL